MAKRAAAEKQEVEIAHPRQRHELIGHASAEQHVLSLYNGKRLPHALLITGSKGIGKATLAYRIARFLLSPPEGGGLFGEALPPESLRVGPEKETFRRVAAGSHSDLLVLESDDIKVDEVRKVAAFLSMTPAESDWRVVIVDSADAMNRNAANALLKTLEEPPPRSLLMLISHNPGTLLPTIRSRCRVLRLHPLTERDFTEVFSAALPEIGQEERRALALLSGGSAGQAIGLHTQDAVSMYRDLMQLAQGSEIATQHDFADRLNRKDAEGRFRLFAFLWPWFIARLCSFMHGDGAELYEGEGEGLRALYPRKTPDMWWEIWERSNTILADAERLYLDKKQTILTLLREL